LDYRTFFVCGFVVSITKWNADDTDSADGRRFIKIYYQPKSA